MPESNQFERTNSTDPEWTALIWGHRPWLLTVIAARVGDWATAEDVFGSMFTEMVGNGKISGIAKLEPWLYRAAINKTIDWHRSRNQMPKPSSGDSFDVEEEIDESALTPLELLLTAERSREIGQALKSLSPEDQEILNLKYVHQWNYTQIGQHLEIGHFQIAHRLRGAKRRLKSALMKSSLAEDFQRWEECRYER